MCGCEVSRLPWEQALCPVVASVGSKGMGWLRGAAAGSWATGPHHSLACPSGDDAQGGGRDSLQHQPGLEMPAPLSLSSCSSRIVTAWPWPWPLPWEGPLPRAGFGPPPPPTLACGLDTQQVAAINDSAVPRGRCSAVQCCAVGSGRFTS
jgi:hypothetical protein